jgi:hypothetical protein
LRRQVAAAAVHTSTSTNVSTRVDSSYRLV